MSNDLYDDEAVSGTVDELAHPTQANDTTEPISNSITVHLALDPYEYIEIDVANTSTKTARLSIAKAMDLKRYKDLYKIDRDRAESEVVKVIETAKLEEKTQKEVEKAEKPKAQFAQEVCPACGGKLYDNRENKLNPKGPDYKCSNKECGKAGWIRTNGKTGAKFTSWSK